MSLNIAKLLKHGIWVHTKHSKEEIYIILVYERFPSFCFKCGKIGHVHQDCDSDVEECSELEFDNCLRATSGSGERKSASTKFSHNPNSESPNGVSLQEVGVQKVCGHGAT